MSRLDEMQKASEGITELRQSNVSVTPACVIVTYMFSMGAIMDYMFSMGATYGLSVLNWCNIWLICSQQVQ